MKCIFFSVGECRSMIRKLAITIPEDMEEIDMHFAEQVWAKKAKEEGILIGEERGEQRGILIGEERGIKLGEERGKAEERQKNIGVAIDMCNSLGVPREAIVIQLVNRYKLTHDEAMALVDQRLS